MKQAKITFYPNPEAAQALESAPSKKVSERVNELLMKGLSKEKEEQIKAEYDRYDRELATAQPRQIDTRGVSTTMLMSQRLFEDEGNSGEDLF